MDIKSKTFDQRFTYDGDDLGNVYSRNFTKLKVWAPTADLVECQLSNDKEQIMEAMTLEAQGCWSLKLEGDFEAWSYVYLVHFGEVTHIATDPYAKASTANHERTVIIDPVKTKVIDDHSNLSPLISYTDAIIYELHVRDFSMDQASGITNKGKFLGLTESGTKTSGGLVSGIDYLADLGVTHIQLLPVYDFGSVDELNHLDAYNWGYDPVQYNVPEGSYCSDINDPYSRIIELKQAIAYLHKKGLRVIMDVVYNHMFDRKASAFEKIVPGYYFRTDSEGNASNGSFCGNDTDSTRPMMHKFMLDSTKMWIQDYGFDGFRFDLMGILDIDTMNAIANQTLSICPNAMIYGEGWNMPTFLDDGLKATMMNHNRMPYIAHFSDIFREKIKGGTLQDDFHEGGFGSGDVRKSLDAVHLLLGTVLPVENEDQRLEAYFIEPKHTVNYVACHDNHTLWDNLQLSRPDEDEKMLRRRQRFMTSMVLISQGIPFLHAGQEFFRSKMGDHNSYKSSDEINMLRWLEKDAHIKNINYVKDLIRLRKAYPELSLATAEEIASKTEVEILNNHVIKYKLKALDNKGVYKELLLLINPLIGAAVIEVDPGYKLIFNHKGSVEHISVGDKITVEPLAIYCLIG